MTDSGLLHDYSRSRAVLIGVSDYRHLPSVPAARASLERMARLLTGPLCGWPKQRVYKLRETARRDALPDRLMTAFDDVVDVALFYFVGHGQLYDDELCLALQESPETGPRCTTVGLPFSDVRSALRACDAQTKIVILDCCFAGRAARPENSLAPPSGDLIDRTSGTGAFTMAASGAYRTAWYESGPKVPNPQTYFTKYLIDAIEQETPGPSKGWTLRDIFACTADALARDGLPEPTQSLRHKAGDFVLARSPSARWPQAIPATEVGAGEVAVLRALRSFGHERRGYDMEQVDGGLQNLVGMMSDPDHCVGLRSPFFGRAGILSRGYRVSAVDAFVLSQRPEPPTFSHALRILLTDKGLLLSPEQAAGRELTELRSRCGVPGPEVLLAAVQLRPAIRRVHRDWLMLTDQGLYVRADGSVMTVPYQDIDGLVVSLATREEWVATGETGGTATFSKAEFKYQSRSLRLVESSASCNVDRLVRTVTETIKKFRANYPE